MQPPVQLTSLVFLQVLVAIGATLLTRFTLRQRHAARGGAWLLVMSAAVAFWSYGAIAEVLLTTPDLKALAAYLEWIAVMLSPLGYLMLVGVYTGSTWLQRPAVQAMALAVAAAALAVVATNELHGLVWDGYLPGSPTGRGFVEPRWGIAFPFIAGFGYVYAAIGVGVLTRAFLRAPAAYRGTFAAVVVAAALPFAVSGIFFIGSSAVGTVLVTASFLISAATMAWCLHRFPVLIQRDGFLRAARETIVEVMDEGVLVVDAGGIVVDANPAASRLLGISGHVVGKLASTVLAQWPEALVRPGAGGAREEAQVAEARSGLVLDVVVSPLPGADLHTDRVIVMRDGTARAAAEQQLAHVAHHDVLTALPNRRSLRQALARAIADGPTTLLLLDLDGFKEVNDTYGHGRGDELLERVAERIRSLLPAGALAARLGGDEFAVLLPRASAADALAIGRDLAHRLAEPVRVGPALLRVTASVGIAHAPLHATDPDGLERCADVAMYRAKRGRRVVAVYDASDDPNTPERLALLAELPAAVRGGQLVIHLQPIVRMGSGSPIGAEALVRWAHPQRGLLPPGAFLPLVEPAGIGRELVREVARQAIGALAGWPDAGDGLQVGINVSALDLGDDALIDDVLALIERSGHRPGNVVLELTEDALLDDPAAVDHINRARREGLRLALDDFGTGYGSLSLLRDVEGATVKVARTFVHRIGASPVDQAVLRGIADVAGRLGYAVVAEGIEDADALEMCAALGCTLAQGFHIARPMPVEQCRAWLADRAAGSSAAA